MASVIWVLPTSLICRLMCDSLPIPAQPGSSQVCRTDSEVLSFLSRHRTARGKEAITVFTTCDSVFYTFSPKPCILALNVFNLRKNYFDVFPIKLKHYRIVRNESSLSISNRSINDRHVSCQISHQVQSFCLCAKNLKKNLPALLLVIKAFILKCH